MEKLLEGDQSPKGLSPLTLAFVGDGVYELLVREYLVSQGNCPVKKLHSRKVTLVRCQAQAQALSQVLWPLLTEEEREVALRGSPCGPCPQKRASGGLSWGDSLGSSVRISVLAGKPGSFKGVIQAHHGGRTI